MGIWGDMWKSAKETGGAALSKLDKKMDAIRDEVARHDVQDPNQLEQLLQEAMGGQVNVSPEQLASLKALARKRMDPNQVRPPEAP